jgi:branched-subunit amino acid aminotransferase/4-amino-4-deoxychorismate lyase
MPRVNAKAKDSEWVRQRKAWETDKPASVNEVLLVTPDGHLLEGLTSNFFVLSDQGAVVTADAGVLNGTVRELILEVRGTSRGPLLVPASLVLP